MLIAPYTTDAPIYHLPIVTGGLILTNIVIFFATTFQVMVEHIEPESVEWLILQFDTINPLQWISSAFMHADFMHLIGNMFFLWAFGLVVEGKIGNLQFLGLYLLMAAIDGAAVQLPMFLIGSDSGALGASGVIFALLIIAMLWAPENEMDCFYFVGFYMGTFEVRIVKLGGCFIALQIFFLWLGGFSMSSEMLHLIGAAIGAFFGVAMLRQNMVDCEGWDFISRNEWLQEYSLLYSPTQRQRRRQKESHIDNPVAAALALHRADDGTDSEPQKLAPRNPPVAKTTAQKKSFFSGKQSVPTTSPELDAAAHPDFNRLAYLFRQTIETKRIFDAQQHFAKLEQMKLSIGLPDKLLMSYVQLLAADKLWTCTLRPLLIVAANNGEVANQARLRLAQIQLKVVKNPQAAAQTLSQIVVPPALMNPENKKLLALRDQLLAQASN